jgi:peptidyl-prolyl cis-trans isomerase-like 4
MANMGPDMNASQFFITLRRKIRRFDKVHSIVGEVTEGFDVLQALNALYVNERFQPAVDVRVLHTFVLDDPTPEISGIVTPPDSPEPEQPSSGQIAPDATSTRLTVADVANQIQSHETRTRALGLQLLGDIPNADSTPAENIAFICRLNKHTREKDLRILFARFGKIRSCQVVTDWKTGVSL